VLGEDVESTMDAPLIYMAIDIQHPHVNSDFNYASFLAKDFHNRLVDIKRRKSGKEMKVNFMWYPLLFHILFYKGKDHFRKNFQRDKKDKWGNNLLVQCWTHILDKHCNEFEFIFFANFFVRQVMARLGVPRVKFHKENLDFLRPKERSNITRDIFTSMITQLLLEYMGEIKASMCYLDMFH
jgi:hypothetical protein